MIMSLVIWVYSLSSVIIISIISLLGIFSISLSEKHLRKVLLYLVSFSAGALMGDAFLHLLPEAVDSQGFTFLLSLSILAGILFSFIVEAFLQWIHCHNPHTKKHIHTFAYMNLVGDAVHNLLDGVIIGASYLVSIPVGIATTVAVLFHEIPQEIGDFGVLLHGGFSRVKALVYNFLIALTSILGVVFALLFAEKFPSIIILFIPFAAGTFIYIAGSDLIPELHKGIYNTKRSLLQLLFLVLGIGTMTLLLYLG